MWAAIGGLVSEGVSLIDDLNYSQEEQAGHELGRQQLEATNRQIEASERAALLGYQGTQTQAEAVKFAVLLGAGAAVVVTALLVLR